MESIDIQVEQPVEQPTQNSNHFVIYSLIAVVVILLGYIGYIYNTKVMTNTKEMQKEYIKKTDITFDTLSQNIQNKYVLKSLYDYKVNQLETQNLNVLKKPAVVKRIVKKDNNRDSKMDTTLFATPVNKNIHEQKIQSVPIKTHKSQTYTCTTLSSSSEYITKICKKELLNFLDKNKDAKRFEVIGLIDYQEFKLIEKLEDVYGKNRVGNLAKYAQTGLSRARVIEATWAVREHLGKKVVIAPVNYTITKKNKRGFVIKAYK